MIEIVKRLAGNQLLSPTELKPVLKIYSFFRDYFTSDIAEFTLEDLFVSLHEPQCKLTNYLVYKLAECMYHEAYNKGLKMPILYIIVRDNLAVQQAQIYNQRINIIVEFIECCRKQEGLRQVIDHIYSFEELDFTKKAETLVYLIDRHFSDLSGIVEQVKKTKELLKHYPQHKVQFEVMQANWNNKLASLAERLTQIELELRHLQSYSQLKIYQKKQHKDLDNERDKILQEMDLLEKLKQFSFDEVHLFKFSNSAVLYRDQACTVVQFRCLKNRIYAFEGNSCYELFGDEIFLLLRGLNQQHPEIELKLLNLDFFSKEHRVHLIKDKIIEKWKDAKELFTLEQSGITIYRHYSNSEVSLLKFGEEVSNAVVVHLLGRVETMLRRIFPQWYDQQMRAEFKEIQQSNDEAEQTAYVINVLIPTMLREERRERSSKMYKLFKGTQFNMKYGTYSQLILIYYILIKTEDAQLQEEKPDSKKKQKSKVIESDDSDQ